MPQQIVGYVENMGLPPTRLDVAAETLQIAQSVAAECDEPYALVNYDLAIAKPALQMQANESPKHDNVFVCFGAFHIQMAYFGAIVYALEEPGGQQILTDTEVLAPGSLNGFLSGKHYNRCRRLHVLLATAIQKLHFRKFLAEQNDVPNLLANQLWSILDQPSTAAIQAIEETEEHRALMEQYEEFMNKTRSLEHGKTAQFWMLYIDLDILYLMFSRASRTNDLDLFAYCLAKLPCLFCSK